MQRQKYVKTKRSGIALVIAMVFIAIFTAMSAGMLSMSSANAQTAKNMQTGNLARSTAESGLEMVRYWMKDVAISGLVSESQRYGYLIDDLEDALEAAGISKTYDADTLTIGSAADPIVLDAAKGCTFYAEVAPIGLNGVDGAQITIYGCAGQSSRQLSRALRVGFTYGVRPRSVFDFGVATKGPLNLGSLSLEGVNTSVEADVYIESLDTNTALELKNAQIAGDVKIVNPSGLVDWSGGQSSIGGEKDQTTAIAEHVMVGVPATEFPVPNPAHFQQYVDGITIDSSNISSYTNNSTLENVRIAAGTNPKFTGNTIIKGVLYIEQPNAVDFGGNANITGVIVGDGSMYDNSKTNTITFSGTVNSTSVTQLPEDAKYDGIRSETGTFLMAPGFGVSFGGNFGTLNGCIVANGVTTYGNAGGEIGGSVINYSTEPMDLSGSDLRFNKSGITQLPSGFVQEVVIHYNPVSYSEVCGL